MHSQNRKFDKILAHKFAKLTSYDALPWQMKVNVGLMVRKFHQSHLLRKMQHINIIYLFNFFKHSCC